MNIPNISPSEVNFLWNEPHVHRHKLPHIGREGSVSKEAYDGLITRNSSRFGISNHYAGIECWGYGMWNSHNRVAVKNMYSLERDEQLRMERLTKIRELGYDYLIPPGQFRSMRALLDDDGASDEIDLDDPRNNLELVDEHGQQIGTRENLETEELSEAEPEPDGDFQHDIGDQRVVMDEGQVPGPGQVEGPGDNGESNELTEYGEEDLDAAIPEAEDDEYDYSDGYDEDEYQRGFMAEEEYLVRDGGEEEQHGDEQHHEPLVEGNEQVVERLNTEQESLNQPVTDPIQNPDTAMEEESDDGVDMSFA
jgi:hypothetical protein